MAYDPNRRLQSRVLQADREVLIAVQQLADYTPPNASYSADKLTAAYQAVEATRAAEIKAKNALAAARDAAAKAEWEFHNAILCAKDQVIAQYGADSSQVQAVGLKRTSERKRPGRRVATKPTE